jgi:hypothetical protein
MTRPDFSRTFSHCCLAIAALAPCAAMTEARAEAVTDNAAPFNINSRLNMQIVYPRFLRFRVGATGATINQVDFIVPAASVGTGTPIAGTGGETGGGSAANVEVVGNFGQVTITATNNSGGLGLGTGVVADGRINYNQIQTASNVAQLPAPVLTNAGGSTSQPTLNATLVTQRTAVWTFNYLNTTVPSAGTFGNTANGGRVTYTATMP